MVHGPLCLSLPQALQILRLGLPDMAALQEYTSLGLVLG